MSAVLAPIEGSALALDGEAFFRLLADDAFRDSRVELLDGDLYYIMAEESLHADTLNLVFEALQTYQDDGLRAYSQTYLALSPFSVPQPDAFLIRRNPRRGGSETLSARDAVLVVEVANTSLRRDRGRKAREYARAGIPEYWIVNPVARQIEVRRRSIGDEYLDLFVLSEEEVIAPEFAPERPFPVAEIFYELS